MDALEQIKAQGYTPYDFADYILVEIYKKLCDIESKLDRPQEAIAQAEEGKPVIDKSPQQEPTEKQLKICKHCGKTHERPQEYAVCGRKKKK